MFHRGVRVASHARSPVKHRHTTIPEHMPSAHRRYAFWTPARLLAAAEQIGPSTVALCEAIMRAKAPSSTSATASASGPASAPRRWRSRRPGVSTARPASRAHAFPENISLEDLAERYSRLKPRLGSAACTQGSAMREPAALLFNRSQK
jgi:hypothetical protein